MLRWMPLGWVKDVKGSLKGFLGYVVLFFIDPMIIFYASIRRLQASLDYTVDRSDFLGKASGTNYYNLK